MNLGNGQIDGPSRSFMLVRCVVIFLFVLVFRWRVRVYTQEPMPKDLLKSQAR